MVVGWMAAGQAGALEAQQGDRAAVRSETVSVALNGRVQTQFNTTSVDGVPASEIVLRRVRFGVTVQVNERVDGRIQADVAGGGIGLSDAYVQVTASPGLRLLAGRAHRPFGALEQISSAAILPIEKGLRIRGVSDHDLASLLMGLGYGDRDVGVQLRGTPSGLPLGASYAVGYFAGPLRGQAGSRHSGQWVARAMASPAPRTRVGVAWSHRAFLHATAVDVPDVRAGNALVADLEYGSTGTEAGPYLGVEAAAGDFDPHAGERFRGAQVWAGYRFLGTGPVTLLEPITRVSRVGIDRVPGAAAPRGGILLTPGFNTYFGGANRVMANYDLYLRSGLPAQTSVKVQMQFAM